MTLPKEIGGFGIMDDVWVTDYKTSLCVAMAQRGRPHGVAPTKITAEGPPAADATLQIHAADKSGGCSVSNIYGAIEGYVGQKQLPQIDPLMLESMQENDEA